MQVLLRDAGSTGDSSVVMHHRVCYSSYTSKHNIKSTTTAAEDKLPKGLSSNTKNVLTRTDIKSENHKQGDVCILCNKQKYKGCFKLRRCTDANIGEFLSTANRRNRRDVSHRIEMTQTLECPAMYHDQCRRDLTREETVKPEIITDNFNRLTQVIEKNVILDQTPMTSTELSCIYDELGGPSTSRRTLLEQITRHFGERIRVCARHGQGQSTIIYSSSMKLSDVTAALVNANSNAISEDISNSFSIATSNELSLEDPEFHQYVNLVCEDIRKCKGIASLEITHDQVVDFLPRSLINLISLLVGYRSGTTNNVHDSIMAQIESVAQDIVYIESRSKKLTPKHVGLGSTIHQKTRSKDIINLLHHAGHTLSYDQLLMLDTCLANKTLKSMNKTNGAVIPDNLERGQFVHFTCDNIDIKDESMDGKNEFHATQFAAWQRGEDKTAVLDDVDFVRGEKSVTVPEVMEQLVDAKMTASHVEMPATEADPILLKPVDNELQRAMGKDMSYHILREQTMC